MTDGRDPPATPAPARGQLTPAEKVMLALMVAMVAMVGGVFVSVLNLQRQVGDLRVEIHQEIGALEERMGRRMDRIEERMGDIGERMARLEAIMEVHFGTPPLPADGAGDSAPAQ